MSDALRVEIKQTAPFESRRHEAYLNLVRSAALLEHALAERLKGHGLTQTQYNALRILRGAGPDGLCRNDMISRMLRPVPDATRLLDRLVAAGLVVRDRGGSDRRYVTARITQRGLDVLEDLQDPVTEMLEEWLGPLSDAELTRLIGLLTKARARGA